MLGSAERPTGLSRKERGREGPNVGIPALTHDRPRDFEVFYK